MIFKPEEDAQPHESPPNRSLARWMGSLTMLIGISIVVGSLWIQQSKIAQQSAWVWLPLLVGMALFWLGWEWLPGVRLPQRLQRLLLPVARWLGVDQWQVLYLGLGPLLAVMASLAAGYDPKMKMPLIAVIFWLAGIICIFIGGLKPPIKDEGESHNTKVGVQTILSLNSTRHQKLQVWSLVFIIGLLFISAFLIRATFTTSVPLTLSGDEGSSGLVAVEFIQGKFNNIFRTAWFSFPALYFFIQSIPVLVLGQTIPALRILSALVGAFTVCGVFLVGRSMFGWLAGFLAAIFLAGFHFHIHFSRIGLNNIWDGFWFVWVFGFVWSGWKSNNRTAWLLAGLGLGLAQYFYVTSRILVFLIPAWVGIAGIFDRDRLKRNFPQLTLFFLTALTTVLPLAIFFARFPDEFMAPMNRVSILGGWLQDTMRVNQLNLGQVLWLQLKSGFLGFTHIPLRTWYMPGTPMLRPVSAAFFLLGMLLLARSPRKAENLLLFFWIIPFGFLAGMSESTPAAQRYVAVAPAVALVIGYSVSAIIAQLHRAWPKVKLVLVGIGIFIIVGLAIDDVRFYFNDYTPTSYFGGDHSFIAQDLAFSLQEKDAQWKVFFFGAPYMGYQSISSLPFLAPHIVGIDVIMPWGNPESPKVESEKVLFVFLSHRTDDLLAVKVEYPDGILKTIYAPDKRALYFTYEVESINESH